MLLQRLRRQAGSPADPARAARVAAITSLVLVTLGAGMLWATYRAPALRELLDSVEQASRLCVASGKDALDPFL